MSEQQIASTEETVKLTRRGQRIKDSFVRYFAQAIPILEVDEDDSLFEECQQQIPFLNERVKQLRSPVEVNGNNDFEVTILRSVGIGI